MRRYEAPAKLNLALHVFPPRDDGYHPVRALVQTIDWCDLLTLDEGADEDTFEITGLEVDPEDNLVARALQQVRSVAIVPPLALDLEKRIPPAAGLGGGSSDAAATLRALADLVGLDDSRVAQIARGLGADVALFLTGGTLDVTGIGEQVAPLRSLQSVAFAVAVPEFGLSTAEVYRRWDEMEGPEGEPIPDSLLPPALRGGMPMRNDLLPAVLDLEPALGDFISDLRSLWGGAVAMTGSGSGCFAHFATLDEAIEAAVAASPLSAIARGAAPRPRGVAQVKGD
ncbi:MAG: 4-(cytidine 5'-diphospho)-2-C-methyl-D-erythritol kinase [Acidimicrobiia bacterium]